jgi:hypothetical protein
LIATSSSGSAGGVPTAVRTPCTGDSVRWCGREWVVTAVHSHPRHGRFARLEDGAGGYDLVHLNGSDGALEQLGPA